MALFHASEDEYVDAVVEFLRPGIEAEEPVALAAPAPRARAVQARLGPGPELQLFDPAEMAHNPGRITPTVLTMLESQGGRRLHFAGACVWPA